MTQHSQNEALKPCPFCGGKNACILPDDLAEHGHQIGIPHQDTYYAHCHTCGADGPQSDVKEQAIAAWNTHTPDPTALLKQALEALGKSRQFIENGREFGYITMPVLSDDPANQTLPLVNKAIAAIRAHLGDKQ